MHLRAELFEPRRKNRSTAHGHDYRFGFDALFFALERIGHAATGTGVFDCSHAGRWRDGDSTTLKAHAQTLRNVGIEAGKNVGSIFEHGDFASARTEYRGKLHADDASADYHRRLRQLGSCKHEVAVDGQFGPGNRKGCRTRTGSYDYFRSCECLAVNFDCINSRKAGFTLNNGHTAENTVDGLTERLDDGVLARCGAAIIEAYTVDVDAESAESRSRKHGFGRGCKAFRGYTASVKACAAKIVALYDGHVHAKARGQSGCSVSARSGADYYKVKFFHSRGH